MIAHGEASERRLALRERLVLDLSDRDLAALQLPTRPFDLRSEVGRFWLEMFDDVRVGDIQPAESENDAAFTTRPMRFAGSRFETSGNWSGAVVAPRGRRLDTVFGRWRAPNVVAVPTTASNLPHTCSVWIGFSGHRRWTTSMPQVGTRHQVAFKGKPEDHYAWFQWWVRDDPNADEQRIMNFMVAPGDGIGCWLEILSETKVQYFIRNFDTKKSIGSKTTPIVVTQTSTVAGFEVKGTSAQWIVERPSHPIPPGKPELYPLPDFGTVNFVHCGAAAGGNDRPLQTPRLIEMVAAVSPAGHTQRASKLSRPQKRGQLNGRLRVRYTGPPP